MFILICIFLIANISTGVNASCDDSIITPYINFMYYTGNTINEYKNFSYNSALSVLQEPTFNPSLLTVFYFHGWAEQAPQFNYDQSLIIIVPELLKIKDKINLIVMDYQSLALRWTNETGIVPADFLVSYGLAVHNATCMANPLQSFFTKFVSQCNCLSNLHLIGFSLGAQIISGMAKIFTAGKFPLITACDPAGPIYNAQLQTHLESTDAINVNVIHSDAGAAGYPFPCGTADFWPNRGIRSQPFCDITTDFACSHYCSVRYLAASVTNAQKYPAQKCNLLNQCSDPIVYMGFWTSIDAIGNYNLTAMLP